MKKYLVLYHSSVPAKEQMAKATPEQAKAGMQMWMQWMKTAASAVVDGGSPLAPVGSANAKVGGYSVLQAKDEKTLMELLDAHPHRHAPGATIEVHELQQLPGM
ncbi:MAG: hypothetical protein IPJ65_37965 [Archangiaceae bacterium]|nr:hypothetical protein [Archangiaceae bacterium]